eukprot:365600-Chlamydomonas_euryale.AAC.11
MSGVPKRWRQRPRTAPPTRPCLQAGPTALRSRAVRAPGQRLRSQSQRCPQSSSRILLASSFPPSRRAPETRHAAERTPLDLEVTSATPDFATPDPCRVVGVPSGCERPGETGAPCIGERPPATLPYIHMQTLNSYMDSRAPRTARRRAHGPSPDPAGPGS